MFAPRKHHQSHSPTSPLSCASMNSRACPASVPDNTQISDYPAPESMMRQVHEQIPSPMSRRQIDSATQRVHTLQMRSLKQQNLGARCQLSPQPISRPGADPSAMQRAPGGAPNPHSCQQRCPFFGPTFGTIFGPEKGYPKALFVLGGRRHVTTFGPKLRPAFRPFKKIRTPRHSMARNPWPESRCVGHPLDSEKLAVNSLGRTRH